MAAVIQIERLEFWLALAWRKQADDARGVEGGDDQDVHPTHGKAAAARTPQPEPAQLQRAPGTVVHRAAVAAAVYS